MAYLGVADPARLLRQALDPLLDRCIGHDGVVRAHRSDHHAVALGADALEPELVQVHDRRRLVQPLLEHRDEGLAASQRLDRIGDAGRLFECEIVHRAYSAAMRGLLALMIDQTLADVAGMSMWRTP